MTLKAVGATSAILVGLLGSVYGVFTLTDDRYFLRAEAQSLQQSIEQQRVDALHRERTDLLRERSRRRGKLTAYEQERLETIERQIKAWEWGARKR